MIPSIRGRATIAIVFTTALLASATSFAEEDAESLIRQGVMLRKQGEDAKAHGYFQRAYEITHTARSAAQLGLSDLAVGKALEAEVHLSEAMSGSDPWIESHRPALEKSRATARAQLGKLQISGAAPEATVEATGRAATRLPADGVVWVNPGKVHVRLDAAGYESSAQDAQVSLGGVTQIRVVMARAKAEPDRLAGGAGGKADTSVAAAAGGGEPRSSEMQRPPEGSDGAAGGKTDKTADKTDEKKEAQAQPGDEGGGAGRRQVRIASIVVGGVGVAAVVAGFVFRGMASSRIDAIKSDGAAGRPYNPSNGNYQTYDKLGVGMIVGGGAAVVGGVVGYFVARDSRSTESNVALGPGPGDAGLMLSGRF